MSNPVPISLKQALWFWLKLGFISFGGPAGQIALMHQELVEKRRWISEKRFLHALNYCMLLPGPEAQQLATYLGWLLHRSFGGILAGALFVLPSLLILIALAWLYLSFGDVPWVAGLFYGIKPAVAAIVVQAAYRLGSRVLHNSWLWAIAAAAFVGLFALQLPFPIIVLGAAASGYLGARIAPAYFAIAPSTSANDHYTPALINDHSPQAQHTLFSFSRLAWMLSLGLSLWAIPMMILASLYGWSGALTQMSWFFTKAALLTFGGAYAVLPYVYQGAVEHFAWVTPAQMMDALALGESTPGPLIMLVAFVAFLAGYGQQVLGPEQLFWAGVLAACLVTWFTFLPSFLFILLGGPLVESSRENLHLNVPLTAISAAVVGVILNLALFFIYHVLWPNGFSQGVDWPALLIGSCAASALLGFKRSVIEVLLLSALGGLAVHLLQ